MKISDIHTHRYGASDSIYNLPNPDSVVPPGSLISVGLHPWDTNIPDTDSVVEKIAVMAQNNPSVVAIGETGLDNRRGAPLDRQLQLLLCHISIAEKTHKPLILHIVGAWSEIIHLKKQLQPTTPWIIHGFRGKPALARQLLDAGFYISIGKHYNPDSVAIIPTDRLFIETDESDTLPVPPSHYDPTLPMRLFDNQSPSGSL
ncbi:MAG: TatD family hydrolase [Muribaculum sp.]|nr:TatD family hydrolase [Muribaculum sp.]